MATITVGNVQLDISETTNGIEVEITNDSNSEKDVQFIIPEGTRVYKNGSFDYQIGSGEHDKCKFKLP